MKFGLFGINTGPCANPATAAATARAAEAAGFDSVWTGEHIVLPEPQVPPSPVPANTPFIDSAVALAYVAGQTKTIRLGTGIIILAQRNPVVLAKELASVDVLSAGRLIFGIGIGYLKPECDAAPRTETASRDCVRRAHATGIQPCRAPCEGVVRIRARRRGNGQVCRR